MKRRTYLGALLPVLTLCLVQGCTPSKKIEILSEPSGAEVTLDGLPVGQTPFTKSLSFGTEDQTYEVEVSLGQDYTRERVTIAQEPKDETTITVTLEPLFKELLITSTPPGAEVAQSGQHLGVTPLNHRMVFADIDERVELVLSLGEEYAATSLDVSLLPRDTTEYGASLTPLFKEVTIESDPPAASVYQGDQMIGQTPLAHKFVFSDLEQSKQLTLRHSEDYQPAELEIGLTPREKTVYRTSLEAIFKDVTIESEPTGASVYLDGSVVGVTPLTQHLRFKTRGASHLLQLKKEHYEDQTLIVFLQPRDVTTYMTRLAPKFKDVVIRSDPEICTVFIDGQEKGITPLKTRLLFEDPDRVYAVTARKKGYLDQAGEIRFRPLEQTDYTLDLDKVTSVVVEQIEFQSRQTERGTELVAVRSQTLAYLETIERSPTVKSVTKITNNEHINEVGSEDYVMIDSPVLSPDGERILYELSQSQGMGDNMQSHSNIWQQKIGSFARTKITYGTWMDRDPVFTPDANFLLFSSNRTTRHHTLRKIKASGSGGITSITNTSTVDYEPDVSPDGKLVAYTSILPGTTEAQIWTITIDGRLPTQLRDGENPKFSPDGNKIMFIRKDKLHQQGKYQLWTMDVDGSNETQVTTNTAYDIFDPAWSPDGKRIVFSSNEAFDSQKRRNPDIWIMGSDGSQLTQLTTNGSHDHKPLWDPQSRYIYFLSNRGGPWNIWRFVPILAEGGEEG